MGILANMLTILLAVIDISVDTFYMGLLLVIPLMVTTASLTRDNRFYSVGGCSISLAYVYKICMLMNISDANADTLLAINKMSTVIALSAYLLLCMITCALLVIKQCKIEGPIEILEKKYQIVDSASLTTLYLWFLIMCIYFYCNGFFKVEVLCATSCAVIGLLSVAFVSLKSTLRKAVSDEEAKRREQDTNRVEVSSRPTN